MSYPLEGIRVLDMSRVLAGPFAGRMLSDLGADVVKVEPPDGDVTRSWGADIGGNPGYYHQQNVGKRNICINLLASEGPELIKALAARADVLIENFRPGIMARYGIAYPALQAINPRLVMLSISGFGQGGPESERAAYAPIIHAEAGLIARQTRWGKGVASDIAVSMADTNAGLHGLVAVLSALLMRDRTGLGQHVDMAMIDATLVTDDALHFGLELSEHTKLLPSEVWETPAGTVLISADFRHLWRQLATKFGLEELSPATVPVEDRITLRRAAAQAFFRDLPDEAAFVDVMAQMNTAWGRVRESEDIREQPTVKHRRTIIEVDDRAGGKRPVVQTPYRFSDADSGVRGGAPWKGEHNSEILGDWLELAEDERHRWDAALVNQR
ncbi:MAG: CaiB/BaiF CoA-transferase family protein [Tepidiformaceae bacterium]